MSDELSREMQKIHDFESFVEVKTHSTPLECSYIPLISIDISRRWREERFTSKVTTLLQGTDLSIVRWN